jgi:signal transduction histidine kinase
MQNKTITFKITITLIALLVLTFSILTIFSSTRVKTVVRTMGFELIETLLNEKIIQIGQTYDNLENLDMLNDKASIEKYQDVLFTKLKEFKFKTTGYLFIYDSDGKVILHPLLKKGDNINNDKEIMGIVNLQKGDIFYDFKGTKNYAVFNRFEKWKWVVGISVNYKEMFKDYNWFLTTNIFMMILAVIVLGYLIFKAIQVVVINPLITLLYVAEDIATGEGDLSKRIKIHSS